MKINLVYVDSHRQDIELPNEETSNFFKCLSSGEVYFNKKTCKGFWTDLNKIRYILAEEVKNEMESQDNPLVECQNLEQKPQENDSQASEGSTSEP